jgi:hypothetical protein
MIVKMTKLKDSDTAEYKNHIEEGKEVIGEITELPKVGECFYVGMNYRTSAVKEIISLTRFRTNNSIYDLQDA